MDKSGVPDGSGEKAVPLPLVGKSVSRCYVDNALGLQFFEGEKPTTIRIETPFRLNWSGRHVVVDPRNRKEVGQAMVLFGEKVSQAEALGDGTLVLLFESGIELRTPPDEHYEAWEIAGPGGFLVVSRPGGGLAVWTAKA